MHFFTFGGAWSNGVGLFSGRATSQAILLIGLGVAAPFIVQYVLTGGPIGMTNPAMLAGGPLSTMTGAGTTILLAMAAGYFLQISAFFGSLRLGLDRSTNLVSAMTYGVIACLVVALGAGVVMGGLGFLVTQTLGALGGIFLVLAFLILFAILYTLIAATMAVAIFLLMTLAMILGVTMGQVGFAATLAGGSGLVAVIAVVVCVLLIWLTARFSCVTPVMADRRSLNPFGAIAESWRLTADDQFKIMLYLASIGLAVAVIAFIGGAVAGIAMASTLGGAAAPEISIGAMILVAIIGIPFGYLSVLVPGGIYREIVRLNVSADIFA